MKLVHHNLFIKCGRIYTESRNGTYDWSGFNLEKRKSIHASCPHVKSFTAHHFWTQVLRLI